MIILSTIRTAVVLHVKHSGLNPTDYYHKHIFNDKMHPNEHNDVKFKLGVIPINVKCVDGLFG